MLFNNAGIFAESREESNISQQQTPASSPCNQGNKGQKIGTGPGTPDNLQCTFQNMFF